MFVFLSKNTLCNSITMRSVVFIFAFISLAFAKNEYYDGFSLYEVSVNTIDQVKLVHELENQLELDIWSHSLPGRAGQILVSKDKKSQFEDVLKNNGVEYKIETENIKELIDLEEKMLAQASRRASTGSRSVSYDKIYTYNEVNEFLHYLAETYPKLVTLVNGGKSFEGRDTFYLKLSTSQFEDHSKPIIFMESLIHAREWVTLPTTLYAIEKLVIDVRDSDMVQNVDWIILPIANPDGYVFTHTTTRFWRKNRATGYPGNCLGVDLNRNFDFLWSSASSNSVCSETFHGRGPFSEPEAAIIRDILHEYRGRIAMFLDIHSYGSYILYGYGTGVLPPNGLSIHTVGVSMAQAIDAVKWSSNRNYIVGNSAHVLYGTSGSAQDYGQLLANYSYTFELPAYRPGVGGTNGFLVDPAFIEQAGFETWEGIKAGVRFILGNRK